MKYFVILLFLISGTGYSQSLWKNLGPTFTEIKSLTVNPNDEVYFGYGNGVWSLTGDDTWHDHQLYLNPVWSLAIDSAGSVYAGTLRAGLFKTTDNGINWAQWSVGTQWVTAITIKPNGYIFAGLWGGAYRSINNGTSWQSIGMETQGINAIICNSKGDLFAATDNGGIFRTTNDGDKWIQINNGLTYHTVHALAFNSQGYIFAGTQFGLFLSTNNGDNWIEADSGITGINVLSLAVNNSGFIYAGTEGKGIFKSTDNGTSWANISRDLIDKTFGKLVINSSGIIYLGSTTGGLYRSINTTNVPVELLSFEIKGNNGSINLSWKTASELNNRGFELERKDAFGDFRVIAFIKGCGTSTELKHYKYIDLNLPDGKYSYRLRQLDFNGAFKFSDAVEIEINAVKNFSLSQNYPNPFNPSTVISYSLPSSSNIKLIVYNTLGQSIKTLESGYKPSGNYSINFNASNLPSGIYFYKLEAGSFTQIKKMMLLK
jgi:hypothetical protein